MQDLLFEPLLGNLFLRSLLACKPVLGNLAWEPVPGNLFLGTLAWEPLPGNPCLGTPWWGTLAWGTLAWELVPGNLAWNLLGTLPENLFLKTFLLVTSSCLGTSCWEPLLGNLFLVSLPGNFAWELCWEPLPGNLAWEPCLGTCSWEPCLGTSCWEPLLGNLFLGTSWEPYLGSFPGNIALEPLPGNVAWEPLPANPVFNLALCGFGCSEGLSWKRKPFLGTRFPTLRRADLAAPACSGTFTMAEDPKLPLLGKNIRFKHVTYWKSCRGVRRCRDFVGFASGFSREDLHEDVPGSWRRPPANRENAESWRKAEPPERRPMKTTKHQQRTHEMPMKHHETAQLNHKETTTDIRKLNQLRRLVFKCYRMTLRHVNSYNGLKRKQKDQHESF